MIHLAIDIGASSGRHIAAWRENGKLVMQEIYRFENRVNEKNGSLVWDLEMICRQILKGLELCAGQGIIPDSLAIDTWGVDYVLLNGEDKPILPLYCYRDKRCIKASDAVHSLVPFETLYQRTGIQYQPFNTVYQLYADKLSGRLEKAEDFLMLPEYLNFFLTGIKAHEYTNCSTTGLIIAGTQEWDWKTIHALGFPEKLFNSRAVMPPLILGRLRSDIVDKLGFDCPVILPATHDTASAVVSLPRKGAFISSGTWSLLGTELDKPITGEAARRANYTNEGGVGTIRFLKNITGLWLVQCLKREYDDKWSFAQLAQMASEEANFDYELDVNSPCYTAPKSIRETIDEECRRKAWPIPQSPGQYAHAIYSSLAHAYAKAVDELEALTGMDCEDICIVGGGVNNDYLNRLTESFTGCKLILGPSEATAMGNILMQEVACNVQLR